MAAENVGAITVVGSASGGHTGILEPDSDDLGASFVPATPFTPGEQVTVTTSLPIAGGHDGSYRFTVSTPVAHSAGPAAPGPSDPQQVETFHSAPALQVPKLTVSQSSATEAAGDLFTAPYRGAGQNGPMITDTSGNLVWFDPLPNGLEAFDFRTQTYAGQPVLTWWQGYVTATGQGYGEDEIYDDTYQPVATVTAGNGYQSDLHEFQLTASGTALVTAYQPVQWDTSSMGGSANGVVIDAIMQEIDVATGNVLFEWHSLDHVALTASYAGLSAQYDYFHINSIDEDAAGNLLISSRGTHTIYQIDRTTGEIVWQLGGKDSDFAGTGTTFNSQHNAKWLTPTTLTIFDNGTGVGKDSEPQSHGLVVALDLSAHTATLVQAYSSPSVPQASSQGNVQTLVGGNVLVGWGAQPFVSEFTPDGTLIFQAGLPSSDQNYRAYLLAWSGHPAAAPAVAATAADGGTTVYASWNGATGVAAWQVLAGASADALATVNTAPRAGFETQIDAATNAPYVAVRALDRAGNVLATSAAVRVGV